MMNQRFILLFAVFFVSLQLVASAPVDISTPAHERALASSFKVKAAKPKAVAKPKVAVKPAAKPKVAAKPKAVAKPKAAKASTKPKTAAKSKATTKPKTAAKPAAAACPLPSRTRRFLEFVGLQKRTTPCPPAGTPSKADKKAAKAAKAQAKAANASAAAAAAAAAKRPVGAVANAPTKDVQCNNRDGGLTKIPLAAIKTAIRLAQVGPVQTQAKAVKFPHEFRNDDGVKIAAACAGKSLEEQAVGPDMSTFQNIPSVLGNFNQFRTLTTVPDASGNVIFCGVMTHGTSTTGGFDKDLCQEV